MEVTDIASYTGMNTDYAIDMSPLDVAVDGPDNIPYHAVLTACGFRGHRAHHSDLMARGLPN